MRSRLELGSIGISEDSQETPQQAILDSTADGVRVPRSYGMDYKDGGMRIQRAFTNFFKIATPAADARKLSTQQRLDLVNERPFDEFFGYCEKLPG